jgi:protein gp37
MSSGGPETMPAAFVPAVDAARARLFDLIDRTPNLDWLLLTKRPEFIRRYWPGGYRAIVWLGASAGNQRRADERIPLLLGCRDLAAVLFLSCEPLLGPVHLGLAERPGVS